MAITKMEVGIHKGQYQVRIQPVNPVTKKRIKIPVQYTGSKQEARKIEGELWAKVKGGYDYDQAASFVPDCLADFIDHQGTLRGWSKRTRSAWNNTLGIISEYFEGVRMERLTEDVVRSFARKFITDRHLTVGPNSVIARVLVHMRAFCHYYVGAVFLRNPVPRGAINVFFKEEEQSLKQERYTLRREEVDELVAEIKKELDFSNPLICISRLAIWVDLQTGMRPQELQALRWSNLVGDDENGYYFHINDAWNDVSKKLNGHLKKRKHGESRDTLPISSELKESLDKYHRTQKQYLQEKKIVNERDLIFLNLNDYQKSASGYPVCQTSLNEMLKRLGDKIGIDTDLKWSLYSLRHTVATKLANTPGISYPWAASVLGHTVSVFMKTYVHVNEEIDGKMRNTIGKNGLF